MSGRFHFDRTTPVTAATLTAYVALAMLTGGEQILTPDPAKLDRFGAAIGARIAHGEIWRLVANTYLHGGVVHLLFNAMSLWSFGPQLERLIGSLRFLVLYLVAGVGGSVAGVLWHSPFSPLIGGSGAIFGMLGAMVALNARHGKSPLDFLQYEGPRQLVSLIFANLVLGFVIPQVSNAAHLGGLLAGFVLMHQFHERHGRHAPDRLGRIVQAGWLTVFATGVLWCAFPLTRWDVLLVRHESTQDDTLRRELAEALAIKRH